MKNVIILFLLLAAAGCFAQNNQTSAYLAAVPLSGEAFSDCAAILFQNQMLVDEYSPKGSCKIEMGKKGKLSLATVELRDNGARPIKNLPFKVAIKNALTQTLVMYSDQEYMEVELDEIMSKCKKGDKIVILTLDQNFALPHNEIEIIEGC